MTAVIKRSVTIRGHRTSISLEQPFFEELEAEAKKRAMPLARLIAQIDAEREAHTNLSSAIRLFVLEKLRAERAN